MTMQQSYPLQQLTPDSTDQEKQQAFQATVQQLVQEGMTPEQAQSQAQRMLSALSSMPPIPTSGNLHMGESMKPPANIMRDSGTNSPKSVGYFRNELDDQGFPGFVHGFNFDGRVSNK